MLHMTCFCSAHAPCAQVEGLMTMIKDKLLETNPFAVAAGDGADPARSLLFNSFMDKLDAVRVPPCKLLLPALLPVTAASVPSPALADHRGPDGLHAAH
jgi:hypothetical protein